MSFAKYPVSGGGSGDVVGPGLSVNNGVVLFDGTTGQLIKDLGVGTANQVLTTNGTTPTFALLVDANISGSAAIAYSKLNLANSIVNADISAIAAIAYSKLAALTINRALVSDASGFVSASAVTSTELGYVSGVTSTIQTQLNARALDSAVVHLAGTENITGAKTFTLSTVFSAVTNQIVLGTTNTTTINSVAPVASRVYTIPDAGGAASFILSAGTNTIAGSLTLPDTVSYTGAGSMVKSGNFAHTLTTTATSNSTFPAGTDTLAGLGTTGQTFSALNTFSAGIAVTGGSAANNSIWNASNVLRNRGGTGGWAVDNTSGNAIISATDVGAFTAGASASVTDSSVYQNTIRGATQEVLTVNNVASNTNGVFTRMQVRGTTRSFIGASTTLSFSLLNSSATDVCSATDAGAWTFPTAATHTFGNSSGAASTQLVVDAAAGQLREIMIRQAGGTYFGMRVTSGNVPFLTTNGAGINFSADSGTTTHGAMSSAGAWTLGSSNNRQFVKIGPNWTSTATSTGTILLPIPFNTIERNYLLSVRFSTTITNQAFVLMISNFTGANPDHLVVYNSGALTFSTSNSSGSILLTVNNITGSPISTTMGGFLIGQ